MALVGSVRRLMHLIIFVARFMFETKNQTIDIGEAVNKDTTVKLLQTKNTIEVVAMVAEIIIAQTNQIALLTS